MEETVKIKALLNLYGWLLGQTINLQKSGIFFSANVRHDKKQDIPGILRNDLQESKYLGFLSLIGRSKKSVFNFLKERLWRRIQGWSSKLLSRVGKAILIKKNDAQAIPSYCMSCFLIPKSLCQEIEKMMNGYWWSSNSTISKGIRWLSWENMSMSNCKWGLDFRDLHGFNLALLGKHYWNFINNPNSIVARVFKARYFPQNHFFKVSWGGRSSFIWSGIWTAKEALVKGYRWVLGDGKDINAFSDSCLREKRDFCVEDAHTNGANSYKICDFFIPDAKKWDEQKVKNNFQNCDAKAILATHIPQGERFIMGSFKG